MRVGDHVHQLARLEARRPREHMQQDRVLAHVPVVRDQHILRPLIKDHIQLVAGDVQRHAVGAGIKPHLAEIMVIINIGHNTARAGVVFEVIQHAVDLIEHPLGILVLHAQLIAVGLADGAVLIRPGVPDMRAQLMNVVRLLLPDPQQLVNTALKINLAQGHDRELFLQIIAVYHAEPFDRMGRHAVLPAGTHLERLIRAAVLDDLFTVLLKYDIRVAHYHHPLYLFCI